MNIIKVVSLVLCFVLLVNYEAHSDDVESYVLNIDYRYEWVNKFVGPIRYHIIGLTHKDEGVLRQLICDVELKTGIKFIEDVNNPNFVLVYCYDKNSIEHLLRGRNLYLQCRYLDKKRCKERFMAFYRSQQTSNSAVINDREVVYYSSISLLESKFDVRASFVRDIMTGLILGVDVKQACDVGSGFCANLYRNPGKLSRLDISLLQVVYSLNGTLETKWDDVVLVLKDIIGE